MLIGKECQDQEGEKKNTLCMCRLKSPTLSELGFEVPGGPR